MRAHEQEDSTDIFGTEDKATVNVQPPKDLINLCHAGGVTREAPEELWARFEHAFSQELREFANACLFGRHLPMKWEIAVNSLEIAAALQHGKLFFQLPVADVSVRGSERRWTDSQDSNNTLIRYIIPRSDGSSRNVDTGAAPYMNWRCFHRFG